MQIAKNAHEHTGSAEAVRPSLRNGFTAYSVLSPVRPELVCHRRQRNTKYHRRLDTCHWGVRTTRLCRPLQPRSSVAAFASIASHPACRDVRNAPLVGWDGYRSEADLPSRSTMIRCDTLARRANQKMLSSSYLLTRRLFCASGRDRRLSIRQSGARQSAIELFAGHFRFQDRAHRNQSVDIDAG
jgi:hypothetical protein